MSERIMIGRARSGNLFFVLPPQTIVEISPRDAQRLSVDIDLFTENDLTPAEKVQILDEQAGALRLALADPRPGVIE